MYKLKRIWLSKDPHAYKQWEKLVTAAGLTVGEEVTYTIGLFDEDNLIATASCYHNIMKYIVVCKEKQSEQLLTRMVIHLTMRIKDEGYTNYFVYTAPKNRVIFESLGFHEVNVCKDILFMEQGTPSFASYIDFLREKATGEKASGIVMNANPFTKGHLHLVEIAASQSDQVYLFVVSEDNAQFSFKERLEMVQQGVAHLSNVLVLPTNNYLVSSAVFPSYFLKEHAPLEIAKTQAAFDAKLFKEKIAPVLSITTRYVGEEPFSDVTRLYNEAMASVFQPEIQLKIIPRLLVGQTAISATKVRQALNDNDYDILTQFLPESTYSFLKEHNYI